MLSIPMLPSNADWDALDRSECNECNDVQYANHYCNINSASEVLVWEDAKVEKQDGYLGQGNRCQVQELCIVKDL